MGLFGKLFEKKECAICGGEIGLLGNRKLEDGNLCKHCARKLSPWFSERRHSTVQQIREQLDYRARNLEELQSFRPDRRIGENDQMIAELRNGIPYRFVVTTTKDYMEENADLIFFRDVSSCTIDVDENSTELKQNNEKGESVSYTPPRYRYSYNFRVKLTIENNPYFDDLAFRLNSFSVDIQPDALGRMPGQTLGGLLFGQASFDPNADPDYRKFMKMCEETEELVAAGQRGTVVGIVAEEEPQTETAVPEGPRFCPNCGAPVTGGKFCGQCGSKL